MNQSFQIGVKALMVEDGKVLLLNIDAYWDLPGGRMAAGEEPHETLLRELAEELPGINGVTVGDLVGWHRARDFSPAPGHALMLMIFTAAARLPKPLILSAEHQSAQWTPIETARERCPQLDHVCWERLSA